MTEDKANKQDSHKNKMQKLKGNVDSSIAAADTERGVFILLTGNGKGKSSSAFGMVMRALGYGYKVGVVQFIKGTWVTGERKFLTENFAEQCKFVVSGEGFTWETQDRERDIAAAQAGWHRAKELILDPEIQFVLLDEINIALRYDYIDIDDVIAFLKTEKPEMTHVCLTGRNAKDDLIDLADLVTEMAQVKHPFKQGIKAQLGVEF